MHVVYYVSTIFCLSDRFHIISRARYAPSRNQIRDKVIKMIHLMLDGPAEEFSCAISRLFLCFVWLQRISLS